MSEIVLWLCIAICSIQDPSNALKIPELLWELMLNYQLCYSIRDTSTFCNIIFVHPYSSCHPDQGQSCKRVQHCFFAVFASPPFSGRQVARRGHNFAYKGGEECQHQQRHKIQPCTGNVQRIDTESIKKALHMLRDSSLPLASGLEGKFMPPFWGTNVINAAS